MRIVSWNVNGIRAAMKKGFNEFIEENGFDIICLQETKANSDQVEFEFPEYKQYWNSAEKKGYSGTAIFSKTEPLSVTYDMGIEEHDKEGRVIVAEYEKFFLVNVYTPNAQRSLDRLPYRKTWDEDFLKFVKDLEKKKPIIICGDLNVAHKEIDLKNPTTNKTTAKRPGNAGFTDQEREYFEKILDSGFIDTFRHFYPDTEDAYTWWSYMFSARKRNIGWRIDYFLCSKNFIKNIKSSEIRSEVMGSDHCPIEIVLK